LASPALDPDVQAFRMPAEWEPHEATWLGWPHNLSDWPGRFAPIPWVYGEIVRILVPSRGHEAKARRVLERVGASTSRVEFFRWPTDRGWTRDFGPICVRRDHPEPEVAVARFRFNGWAKYPDHRKDDLVAERAAKALRLPVRHAVHKGRPVVLEGGAVDVDGQGTILATEECLLDPFVQVRNPGFKRADYEDVFRASLGATRAIWLGKGIAGDDTHGHVDDLARFADERTIVLVREKDPKDENYRALEENRERLADARLADGTKPEVVDLPMAAPLHFDGRRLPASYANFYVANAAVLVPTFNDPSDRVALGTLAELFTDRPVVGIHAVDEHTRARDRLCHVRRRTYARRYRARHRRRRPWPTRSRDAAS
jgi:agmatine deiminase